MRRQADEYALIAKEKPFLSAVIEDHGPENAMFEPKNIQRKDVLLSGLGVLRGPQVSMLYLNT